MSDIGILNGPVAIAFVLLLFGAPGLPLGALAGALAWRGAGSAALCSAPLRLWPVPASWLYFSDNL